MDLENAKKSFSAMMKSLCETDSAKLLEWISKEYNGFDPSSDEDDEMEVSSTESREAVLTLEAIRIDLQDSLPNKCVFTSEKIIIPKNSEVCGEDARAVEHVDAFVYDEDDLDIACEEGKFSRVYCSKCGSRLIKDLRRYQTEFISHSLSVDQVKFLSTQLLSGYSGKTLLDIGSRTGAILYGAYLFSDLGKITGVEISKEFTDICQSVLAKYKMEDRVTLYNDDILNCAHLIQQADVVVMNNVFEFFADRKLQHRLWRFCLDEIRKKKGTILITNPGLTKSLKTTGLSYSLSFLEKVDISTQVLSYANGNSDVDSADLEVLHVYRVK